MEVDYDGSPEKATSSTALLTAIGFLVRQNKKEVVIAMDMDPKDKEIRFTLAIPRKMVQKVEELVLKNAENAPST